VRSPPGAHSPARRFTATADALATGQISAEQAHAIAPEIAELKDAERLARQEKEAARTRFLRFFNDGHGATYGRFKLGIGDGEAVRAVIDAIAKRDLIGDDITAGHVTCAPWNNVGPTRWSR